MSNQRQAIVPISDLVLAIINGQKLASSFLSTIKGSFADPDSLYYQVKELLPEVTHLETLTTLRGFCRGLQKEIERGDA